MKPHTHPTSCCSMTCPKGDGKTPVAPSENKKLWTHLFLQTLSAAAVYLVGAFRKGQQARSVWRLPGFTAK